MILKFSFWSSSNGLSRTNLGCFSTIDVYMSCDIKATRTCVWLIKGGKFQPLTIWPYTTRMQLTLILVFFAFFFQLRCQTFFCINHEVWGGIWRHMLIITVLRFLNSKDIVSPMCNLNPWGRSSAPSSWVYGSSVIVKQKINTKFLFHKKIDMYCVTVTVSLLDLVIVQASFLNIYPGHLELFTSAAVLQMTSTASICTAFHYMQLFSFLDAANNFSGQVSHV